MQEDVMTKDEFLYALKRALAGEVSAEVFNENMRYYEEYISSELQKGKREIEVMRSLGDPHLIAKTIIETSSGNYGNFYTEERYDSYTTDSETDRDEDYINRNGKGGKMHILSGWKATVFLIAVFLLLVLILLLIMSAIGTLIYFLGPVFLILVLIWLILSRE